MIRFPFSKRTPPPEAEVGGALNAPTAEEQEAREAELDAAFEARRAERAGAGEVDENAAEAVETVTVGEAISDAIGGGAEADGEEEDALRRPIDRTPMEEQMRMVEAMLFASDKPLSTAELASRMPLGCDAAVAVRRLEEMYAGRGVALARVAGKWAFRTAPDLAHLLTGEAVEERKLSRAAVETLAIVAYHQPVTRAEIEEIRQVGVSKGTVDLLMELEWIKLGRRRQTPGRPVTFVTTERFLQHFGLESLKDLPRLEELRQSGLLDSTPPRGFSPKLGAEEGDDEDFDDADDDEGDDAVAERGAQEDFLV